MRTLILSCSTGEGHNSAANAIYEELINRNEKVFLKDALSFGNKNIEKVVKSFFNGVAVNNPNVFGIMYKAGSIVSNHIIKSPVYLANLTYADKLYKYIVDNKIDAVLCTHLFPMEALTYLKRTKKLKSKCYAILTDYTRIPFIEETELDGYFIPHEDLKSEFVKKGISSSKIYSTGIPVSKKFIKKYEKQEAKKILNLPIDKKILLIMGGGVGCGNIVPIVESLTCECDVSTLCVVLTGKNKSLKKAIEKDFNKEKVLAVDFTKKVEIYMDACDILLSKPGGLSSTEAAVKEVALIHTMPIPGCETKNAMFFAKKNMSIKVETIEQLTSCCLKLLNNFKLQKKLIKNQKKYINKYASKDICDLILNNN